jgi:L-seryl-tRNA(Ser) seleniumtransferase
MKTEEALRTLPSVEAILSDDRVAPILVKLPRNLARMTIRDHLTDVRTAILAGKAVAFDWPEMIRLLDERTHDSLGRAINGQGVVLHTGLGRAALSKAARRALADVAENFCNLAIDLETGRRGERYAHVADLLCELTGAEAAMVVNNNAAATMLILNTMAAGKEAIISRGQLVEIGGAFRMPDIMERSNVKMVEVGTTNRTHLKDYRAAITANTGLLIRVHMSNYKIVGFTKEVPLEELVVLGSEFKIPVVDDLGSGALIDLSKYGLPKEPMVQESVAAGADVVCFSGDKLLGGPQCGIIIGRKACIEPMKKNPLTRALRCGKLTYAALEATLRLFFDPEQLGRDHAVMALLLKPLPEMQRQAERLLRAVADLQDKAEFDIRDATSEIGSGSLATEQLPTKVVAIRPKSFAADDLARRLRQCDPPVFGRVADDALLLDFRTIREDEIDFVAQALRTALQS